MSTIQSQPKARNNRSTVKRTTAKAITSRNLSDLQSRIEIAAYYKAQARGFAPGHELEDWLAAEKEVA